jgi:hypothetical protein
MDHDIDWESKDLTPQNQALEGIRSQVDGALKSVNPDYEAAMKPVADGTQLLEDLKKQFNLERVAGQGYRATNSTAANLESALRDKSIKSRDLLQALKDATGTDFMQGVADAKTADTFIGGRPNGSRRTLLGAVTGGALGLPVAGSAAGYAADQYGHGMAGGIVDQLVKLSQAGLLPSGALRRAIAAAMAAGVESRTNPGGAR